MTRQVFYIAYVPALSSNCEATLCCKHCKLLQLLFENREKIIDRPSIRNLCRGNDSFYNSYNPGLSIAKLCRRLKENPTPEIIPAKGIGYRFVAG